MIFFPLTQPKHVGGQSEKLYPNKLFIKTLMFCDIFVYIIAYK